MDKDNSNFEVAPPARRRLLLLAHGLGWTLLLAVGLASLLAAGCRSTPKAPPPLAAVRIEGNTPGQISHMAVTVFGENGYGVERGGLTDLVFGKKAGKMSTVVYGDWLNDPPLWVRVKVKILPLPDGAFRLQCNVYRVKDRDGSIEEEVRLRRRGPYQKLLEEVAHRFQQ